MKCFSFLIVLLLGIMVVVSGCSSGNAVQLVPAPTPPHDIPHEVDPSPEPVPTTSSSEKTIAVSMFRYGFDPDPIVVHTGDHVKLVLTARDVAHGFYVGEYGINVQVRPGEEKTIEFVANIPGTFTIRCSVSCGPGHKEMKGTLIVQ